ncbi:hypothetical protein PIB30_078940, partial [Stylosanthes scabra]|nr:hypothetical protein [Stylosanthes scabra]
HTLHNTSLVDPFYTWKVTRCSQACFKLIKLRIAITLARILRVRQHARQKPVLGNTVMARPGYGTWSWVARVMHNGPRACKTRFGNTRTYKRSPWDSPFAEPSQLPPPNFSILFSCSLISFHLEGNV